MSILDETVGKVLGELASWDLPLLRRVLPPPAAPAAAQPPGLPMVCYEHDPSKSPEEAFVEVAKLCARGYAYIDLQGRRITGLTLVFNSYVTLQGGVIDVVIPVTPYPGAHHVTLLGNIFSGPADLAAFVLGPVVASL